jgi:GntR family transcriptional repressor for pyruvate dehydrogenase complex
MQPATSLVEQVCLQLSAHSGRALADQDGWLPSERRLAECLEVSRTVVREATKRLELQGLLEVQHGVGIRYVDRLHEPFTAAVEILVPEHQERLKYLAEARTVIEPQLARWAAERATKKQLQALRTNQQRFAASVDTALSIQLDLEFHRLLAQAAGNRVLEMLLESMGELGRKSRQATLAFSGVGRAVEHHERILKAVEAQQGDVAFDAMLMHVQGSARDLLKLFKHR